jgi:hypothetical protein
MIEWREEKTEKKQRMIEENRIKGWKRMKNGKEKNKWRNRDRNEEERTAELEKEKL